VLIARREGKVVVPFSRWLFAVVASSAPVLLLSGCSLPGGAPIPGGVPPPPGDPIPAIAVVAPGRPADQLRGWAEQRAPALDIPVTALEAYAYAARVVEIENPGCHLAWTTLAGIGKVESQHGTYRGAGVASNGDVTPPIRGVRLDGTVLPQGADVDRVVSLAPGCTPAVPLDGVATWRCAGGGLLVQVARDTLVLSVAQPLDAGS
jgi:hypothetical protein